MNPTNCDETDPDCDEIDCAPDDWECLELPCDPQDPSCCLPDNPDCQS